MRKLILWIIAIWHFSGSFAQKSTQENIQKVPILLGILYSGIQSDIGKECREDVNLAIESLMQREIWALKMLDSSGDFETNFIWQNVYWLGSREFCSAINSPIPVYTEKKTKSVQKLLNDLPPFQLDYRLLYGDIKSKYQILYEYTITTVLHLGLCVPKSCSDKDILSMSQKYFNEHRVHPFFDMEVYFTHVRNMKFDWTVFNNWIFKLLTGIILAIILVHVLREKMIKKSPNTFFRHFSMRNNYNSLMSCAEDPKIVYSLNFFRTICSCWVTVAHVYLLNYVAVESIPLNGMHSKLFYIRLFYRSALILDVFFLMSGFVLVYNFLKNHELCETIRKNTFKENLRLLIKHILHRYTRFFPTVAATLILSRISHLIFDSIFYRDMRHNLSMESSGWIWNVLFIQNFVPFSRMAIVWTWSMACDMQCFIIFQTLLFIYIKYPRYFKLSMTLVIVLSLGLSYNCMLNVINSEHFEFSYHGFICLVDEFYMKLYYRIITYACGVCIGYIGYRTIGKEVKISKVIRRGFWITIVISLGIIVFFNEDYVSPILLPFLFTFGRITYTLLGGFVILFGQWGYCNWINEIGKTPFFMKMTKLSFTQYMFHPIFIHIIMCSHNDVTSTSFISVIYLSITTAIFTYYFSMVFNVFVEAPLNRVFDDIMQMKKVKEKIDDNKNFM